MWSLPPSVRIFVFLAPCDMRRSFDGLAALVEQFMGEDPLSGHLFVFTNRRGDRLKILYWDRDGYALWYKRLEKGAFALPPHGASERKVLLSAPDLMLLLDGVDLSSVKRKKRYEPGKAA